MALLSAAWLVMCVAGWGTTVRPSMPTPPDAMHRVHACNLHYLDVGSNKGDSIEDFVMRQPELRVRLLLDVALADWHPRSTCVYGFEPNARWNRALANVSATLAPMVAHLEVHTETALVSGSQTELRVYDDGKGDSTAASVAVAVGRRHNTARGVNIVDFLRSLPLMDGAPIVLRMDVEGSEYSLLRALATSGLGATRRIFVGVEWHRYLKERALGGPSHGSAFLHLLKLDKLMGHFNRGSPALDARPSASHLDLRHPSLLWQAYEKVLTFMLGAANMTTTEHVVANLTSAEMRAMQNRRRR